MGCANVSIKIYRQEVQNVLTNINYLVQFLSFKKVNISTNENHILRFNSNAVEKSFYRLVN